jgi:hypothetical protein
MEHRFVILVPGGDTHKLLDEFRDALFAEGFYGAYSFPPAAPLAEVSRPFSRDELKKLAVCIRDLSAAHDGKISGAECCLKAGFGTLAFFGPLLDLPAAERLLSETAAGKIIRAFFPPVLCAALVDSGAANQHCPPRSANFSFRAAALANLAIRSLNSGKGEALPYSFEWETGPLVWLPAYRKIAPAHRKAGAEK